MKFLVSSAKGDHPQKHLTTILGEQQHSPTHSRRAPPLLCAWKQLEYAQRPESGTYSMELFDYKSGGVTKREHRLRKHTKTSSLATHQLHTDVSTFWRAPSQSAASPLRKIDAQ